MRTSTTNPLDLTGLADLLPSIGTILGLSLLVVVGLVAYATVKGGSR